MADSDSSFSSDDDESEPIDFQQFVKSAMKKEVVAQRIVDIRLEDFRGEVAQYNKVQFWDTRYLEDLEPFEVCLTYYLNLNF